MKRGSFGSSPGYFLFVLTLVGAVNWADRQVVPILFPTIKRELELTDTQLGIVGGLAFSLVYAVASFAFGHAADRRPRKHLIAIGLVIWSAATAASGLATGFWSLFAARFFTGVGEASLYPCALSLIAERFTSERRGRALGVFAAAAAIGGGLGVGLGGRLSVVLGFRSVFFLYGSAGLLCLPLLFLLQEEPRPPSAATAETPSFAIRKTLEDRRLLWMWACGALAMASGQGFAAWGPSYFVRQAGLDVTQAGALFGASALLGGITGGLLGGTLADRRRRARTGGEFDVACAAALLGSALIFATLAAGTHRTPGVLAGLLATLSIYALFPAILSGMLAIVPPHRHGIAGALNTFFLGGIGAASGPFVVGAVSDRTGDLRTALFLPVFGLLIAAAAAVKTGRAARSARSG